MRVCLSNKQRDLPIPTKWMRRVAAEVIAFETARRPSLGTYTEVGLHFITSRAICRLHAEYFDDPSPTDCISFPIDNDDDGEERLLGDIFVCPKVAIAYATAHDTDAQQELLLYVVHGLLHLLGYDDISTDDRKKMRAAEARHLRHLEGLNIS